MDKQEGYFGIAIATLIAFAYFLQSHLLLTSDVVYLIHVSEQLLAGGNYVSDFFESNPPMILYLYLPIVFAKQYLHVSLQYALYGYLYFIAITSTIVCYVLLKRIFPSHHQRYYIYHLMFAICFMHFYFPTYQFGQREHLFMMFLLPYLFATVLFLANKPIYPGAAFIISFFVALGFAFKPFFLFTFIFIEIYIVLQRKNTWAFLRLETLTILAVWLIYALVILKFYPNYYFIILPLIKTFYFFGFAQDWLAVMIHYVTFYCLLAAMLYIALRKSTAPEYKVLTDLLLISMLGMLLAYLIPRMPWYYHVLPAFAFALLLLTYYFTMFFESLIINNRSVNAIIRFRDATITCMLGISFYALPIAMSSYFFYVSIQQKYHSPREKVIHYLASAPGPHSISCITIFSSTCFPLVNEVNADLNALGRFPFFWWVKGALKYHFDPASQPLSKQIIAYQDYLLQSFAQDLKHFQPRFVIVHQGDLSYSITHQFNYIDFMQHRNKAFRDEWKHYHLQKKIAYYHIYQRQ